MYGSDWSMGSGPFLWTSSTTSVDFLRDPLRERKKILELLARDAEGLDSFIHQHIQAVYDTIGWYIR